MGAIEKGHLMLIEYLLFVSHNLIEFLYLPCKDQVFIKIENTVQDYTKLTLVIGIIQEVL